MQVRGGIVARVDARQGVADALSEFPVLIGAHYALVDGVFQGRAHKLHLLAERYKDDRHARILADGHLFPLGSLFVFQERGEGKLRRPRLALFGAI